MKIKFVLPALLFLLSPIAFAGVVKECSVSLHLGNEGPMELKMEVIDVDGALHSRVTQTVGGNTVIRDDIAEMHAWSVREGLASRSIENDKDLADLNEGEGLILHAMTFDRDPELRGAYSSGIDLTKVRSVTAYTIGQRARFGSTTVLEARDADGKTLGSFLGGFLVSACK